MVSVKELDKLLPQTQCGECGYSGCLPYAEALAQGIAPINKCPPGGAATVKALAFVLHQDPIPYLAEAIKNTRQPSVAVIDEDQCIGCTKCIRACPVDAIVGSAKLMHAIITQECTGCGLCVAPCPVDCISMMPLAEPEYNKDLAKERFVAKKTRLLREEHERQQSYREKKQLSKKFVNQNQDKDRDRDRENKQKYIQQALARVKEKQNKNLSLSSEARINEQAKKA